MTSPKPDIECHLYYFWLYEAKVNSSDSVIRSSLVHRSSGLHFVETRELLSSDCISGSNVKPKDWLNIDDKSEWWNATPPCHNVAG